jgi:hypothetical protein
MFYDLPLFRLSDPVTSREGAKAVKPRRTSQAMLLLAEYQHKPLTDEEAGMASGLALNLMVAFSISILERFCPLHPRQRFL